MRRTIGWATIAAVATGLAIAPAAIAKDRDIEVNGTCSGPSRVELDLDYEDGGLEAEVEVDQNRVGVRWRVALFQNGKRVASRVGVTRGRSGSFEARFLTANRAGADRFVARASRPGEVCTVHASIR